MLTKSCCQCNVHVGVDKTQSTAFAITQLLTFRSSGFGKFTEPGQSPPPELGQPDSLELLMLWTEPFPVRLHGKQSQELEIWEGMVAFGMRDRPAGLSISTSLIHTHTHSVLLCFLWLPPSQHLFSLSAHVFCYLLHWPASCLLMASARPSLFHAEDPNWMPSP